MARLVAPGFPHHVTQRGARRQQVFFSDADYAAYLDILGEEARGRGVTVWAYCLMPNHAHLVLVPDAQDSLARTLGVAHARYARRINQPRGWSGHLWQSRFFSCPMDEAYTVATVRYILRNPVRSGLTMAPEEWAYSSARDLLGISRDPLVTRDPLAGFETDWPQLLLGDPDAREVAAIRHGVARGRPLGAVVVPTLEPESSDSLKPPTAVAA